MTRAPGPRRTTSSRTHRSLRTLAVLAALALTAGCAATGPADPEPQSTPRSTGSAAITLPPTTGAADYQLGGAYLPAKGVTVVTRDSTAKPAEGVYSICYVNGFQTQPGATWPDSLILHTSDGEPLVDPGWPDEHILDISTAAKREQAASRLASTIDGCAKAGFRGVEFDNLDSYSRSKGALTLDDAVAFATILTARAHRDGLAVGQKNTGELGARGRDTIGFDFAVAEECDQFSECGSFTKVYGAHVIDIEYTDELRRPFAEVCADKATPALTILRDRELVARGSDGYTYEHC